MIAIEVDKAAISVAGHAPNGQRIRGLLRLYEPWFPRAPYGSGRSNLAATKIRDTPAMARSRVLKASVRLGLPGLAPQARPRSGRPIVMSC